MRFWENFDLVMEKLSVGKILMTIDDSGMWLADILSTLMFNDALFKAKYGLIGK